MPTRNKKNLLDLHPACLNCNLVFLPRPSRDKFTDMALDLQKLHQKKGATHLSALPPSAQAFLGCQLKAPQLWVVDHFQTLEKLADSFRTFSKHWKKMVLIFQGLETGDMELTGESLKTLQFLQSRSDEPFVLLTLQQALTQSVPNIGNPLIGQCFGLF